MKTTRRGFFKTAGLGTAAGLIGGTALITPSVLAQTRHNRSAGVFDNGNIQLSQN
ncbi:MAG: twin-arginine translocation signal domain-containing protein [Pseudomonadota bacterium]|nr:twin-arginine translocation signal domain-containing protein [Pseudomonadota bacterium]